jgi:hypothetical protein
MAARSSQDAPRVPCVRAVHVYVALEAPVSLVMQMASCVQPALKFPLAQT